MFSDHSTATSIRMLPKLSSSTIAPSTATTNVFSRNWGRSGGCRAGRSVSWLSSRPRNSRATRSSAVPVGPIGPRTVRSGPAGGGALSHTDGRSRPSHVSAPRARRVLVLVLPEVHLLDLAGPCRRCRRRTRSAGATSRLRRTRPAGPLRAGARSGGAGAAAGAARGRPGAGPGMDSHSLAGWAARAARLAAPRPRGRRADRVRLQRRLRAGARRAARRSPVHDPLEGGRRLQREHPAPASCRTACS